MALTQNPLKSRRFRLAVCAVLISAMAATACGNDDDADGQRDTDSPTTSAVTTTQPTADSVAEIRPFVERLLSDWDASMTAILADPRPVAEDANHRLSEELADSFTSDSPYVRDLGLLLQGAYIDQDAGVRPGPSGLVQQTSLLHFTEVLDDDHVGFVFCTFDDGVGYTLSTGADRPPGVSITQGAGEAARVNGEWRLYRLRQLGHEAKPADTPNPCPDLVEPESEG